MNDEEAKAIQEIAKVTPRALDSLDAMGHFVEDAFGYPIREAGGFLGDWIKFKRDNWRVTCEKVKATLDERGVDQIEPIPAKYGVSIIEKAALEDDELIQSMWAALIVNRLDPSKKSKPLKMFITILSEMESLDALIINEFYRSSKHAVFIKQVSEKLEVTFEDVVISASNLERLGLTSLAQLDGGSHISRAMGMFSFTPLCKALMNEIKISVSDSNK